MRTDALSSGKTPRGGDGLVDYPLALSRIIVEMRDQVVYVVDDRDDAPIPATARATARFLATPPWNRTFGVKRLPLPITLLKLRASA